MKFERDCSKCDGTGKEQDPVMLGRHMRRRRKSAGITMATMAKRLKVTPSYLSELESGKRTWPADRVAQFEKNLK